MEKFLETHSNELFILLLTSLIMGTLLILVPQLLRSHHRQRELQHVENMRALEQGQTLPPRDERSRSAGRTASLVPMVAICAAATVTCFLTAFKSQYEFGVSLTVWCVAGVIGLAAITGGVALMGRLAQLGADSEDESETSPPEK